LVSDKVKSSYDCANDVVRRVETKSNLLIVRSEVEHGIPIRTFIFDFGKRRLTVLPSCASFSQFVAEGDLLIDPHFDFYIDALNQQVGGGGGNIPRFRGYGGYACYGQKYGTTPYLSLCAEVGRLYGTFLPLAYSSIVFGVYTFSSNFDCVLEYGILTSLRETQYHEYKVECEVCKEPIKCRSKIAIPGSTQKLQYFSDEKDAVDVCCVKCASLPNLVHARKFSAFFQQIGLQMIAFPGYTYDAPSHKWHVSRWRLEQLMNVLNLPLIWSLVFEGYTKKEAISGYHTYLFYLLNGNDRRVLTTGYVNEKQLRMIQFVSFVLNLRAFKSRGTNFELERFWAEAPRFLIKYFHGEYGVFGSEMYMQTRFHKVERFLDWGYGNEIGPKLMEHLSRINLYEDDVTKNLIFESSLSSSSEEKETVGVGGDGA